MADKLWIMIDVKDPALQRFRSDDWVTLFDRSNKYTIIVELKRTKLPLIQTTTYVGTEGVRELYI